MSESKFKKGDVVGHKTTDKFEMVIVDNAYFENPTIQQVANRSKNPERYHCKYYNPDTKVWEEKDFYEWELESLDD